MITTAGNIFVEEALPEKYRGRNVVLDEKGIADLTTQMAKEMKPVDYIETLQKLNNIGRNVATNHGGTASISLEDLIPPPEIQARHDALRAKVRLIQNSDKLDPDEKGKQIIALMDSETEGLDDALMESTLKQDNAFAHQLKGGFRGKKFQLRQMMLGNMLSMDSRGRTVAHPGLEGYGQGVSPMSYWASAHGSRKGYVDLQQATADAGYFCLEETTMVRMGDFSSKAIRDIKVGDIVMGADMSGLCFPVEVSNLFDNGERPVYNHIFRKGRSKEYINLISTEEHKVLTTRKQGKERPRETKLIAVGDIKRGRPAIPFSSPGYKTGHAYKFAYLLGALLGDGCIARGASLSCADSAMVGYLNDYLPSLGLKLSAIHRDNEFPDIEYCIVCETRKRNLFKTLQVNPINIETKRLELTGKHSYEKTIPAEALNWDFGSIAELIAGLYDTDGCVSHTNNSTLPRISFSSTSLELITALKTLQETVFSIWSSPIAKVKAVKSKMVKYKLTVTGRRPSYTIVINNVDSVVRFMKYIPLKGCKKQKLEALFKCYRSDFFDNSYTFNRVGKEPVGMRRTFDIEVAHPDHLFVLANGLIVSNSKQLTNVAHRSVITEPDCGARSVGLSVQGDDKDNVGAVLAQNAGPFKKGEIITDDMLPALSGKDIMIRSPITCRAKEGLCALCTGVREKGKLPDIGEHVGINAVRSFTEPLTQSQISAKHTAGEKASSLHRMSSFKQVNQFMQVPEEFVGGAVLSKSEGTISGIEKAPQGGSNIIINGEKHHVPENYEIKVKPGDKLEAGDVLTDGMVNPEELVGYKGIGEGRRYFLDNLRKTLDAGGASTNRRNLEILAKAFINKVRITDPEGHNGHLPDDIVDYDTIAANWQPREGSGLKSLSSANKLYLEQPYLHYSVGTQVTPHVADNLRKQKIEQVMVHKDPPPFQPEVIRARDFSQYDKDWMVQLSGENLKKSLLRSATTGGTSEMNSTSYYPKLVSIDKINT